MVKSVGLSSLVLAVSLSGCAGKLSFSGHAALKATPVVVIPAPVMAAAHASAHVKVRVSFFGIPLDGADEVVFVLDRSGSMGGRAVGFAGRDVGMSGTESAVIGIGGTIVNAAAGGQALPSKLAAAKDELRRTLRAMPDGTRFNIVFFDDEVAAFSQTMMVLHPGTRAAAEAFVAGISPRGSTAAVPALKLAYAIGAARVVLLSDGLANNGGNGSDLLRDARWEIARGVRFDTVGVGIDQDDGLLRTLAAESGGMAVVR